jgi:hypothetical protein
METSVDTMLACSLMVILALSAMAGVLTVVHPYLQDQPSPYDTEMSRKLAEYLLLETGNPSNWGSQAGVSLVSFGLAKAGYAAPFDLDIDKVTRLNQENYYSISYLEAFAAVGAQGKPFRISVRPVFNVSLSLASQVSEPTQAIYYFDVSTKRSELPVAASLRCYTVLGNDVFNASASTSSSGVASLTVTLPNSLSGTALLVAIAKVEPNIMSYAVCAFKHNSAGAVQPQGTFADLSPLNHALRAELLYAGMTVTSVKVFSYNYCFNLEKTGESSNIEYYGITQLSDASPMVISVTGLNGSASFVEWVAYPQVPLDFGSNFTGQYDVMDAFSFHFMVSINSAVYECEVTMGGT